MKQDEVLTKIKDAIEEINFALMFDGGGCEYVDYKDNIVFIRLVGNCMHCLNADKTIEGTVLVELQAAVPEVKGVINVPV